jgi:hypothetical protein
MDSILPISDSPVLLYTLAAVSLSTLISLLVGTLSTEYSLFFGNKYCLLYVENYHNPANSTNTWVFDAYSSTCSGNAGMGWISIIALVAVVGVNFWMRRKETVPSRHILLALAVTSTLFAFVCFVCAAIASAGLAQT